MTLRTQSRFAGGTSTPVETPPKNERGLGADGIPFVDGSIGKPDARLFVCILLLLTSPAVDGNGALNKDPELGVMPPLLTIQYRSVCYFIQHD